MRVESLDSVKTLQVKWEKISSFKDVHQTRIIVSADTMITVNNQLDGKYHKESQIRLHRKWVRMESLKIVQTLRAK